ncbi:hypothetical protein ACS0TY_008201 [Phlomoides rotata]
MTIASTERMSTVRVIILFLSTTFCFYLFHTLIRFLHKVWWKPTRLQTLMSSQGIRGPSYRFPHGNTKQISNMRSQSMEKPMDISHDIFARIQPHVCAWTKAYGANFLNWYGPQAQLVITEAELVREILNDKDGKYPKIELEGFAKKLLGDGGVFVERPKVGKDAKTGQQCFPCREPEGN